MIRQLYIHLNHITLLVTLLYMVNTPESLHCRPVPVCHIRLPHFAAAISCRDLVSGIGYSTVPYFGSLGRFWYYSLSPSNWSIVSRFLLAFLLVNWSHVYWFPVFRCNFCFYWTIKCVCEGSSKFGIQCLEYPRVQCIWSCGLV